MRQPQRPPWEGDVQGMRRGEPAAWPQWRPEYLDAGELISAWAPVLARPDRVINVYLHVPYCQSSCRFCMYWSRATRDPRRLESFTAHMVDLLARFGAGHQVTNAYIGGGTPSYLGVADLQRLLEAFGRSFRVRHGFTMEANPRSLDEEKLDVMARHQVNRLSLGVQAFEPRLLRRIGRVNGPWERTAALVRRGRALGFEVNVDIMCGLPGQQGVGADELRRAMDLGADSVTVYRFQPTERLPEHGTVRYDLMRRMRPEILRAGYIPWVPRDDSDFGAKLWKPGPALLRVLGRSLSGLNRDYGCFSKPDTHLLGLGPGAWSHLHGYAWYRDVTSLTSLADGPVYCGTRLSPAEERRAAVRRRLHAGWPLRVAAICRHNLERALQRALERGGPRSRGPWEWVGAAHALDELMPPAAHASPGEPPSPVEPRLRFDAPSDASADGPARTNASASALSEWLEVVGEVGAAEIVHGTLQAQIEPPPAPPLVVGVDKGRPDVPAYARTERYSLFYVGARELTTAERSWLDALVQRTRRVE